MFDAFVSVVCVVEMGKRGDRDKREDPSDGGARRNQRFLELLKDVQLCLEGQGLDGLHDPCRRCLREDEADVIDVREERHHNLAVHAIDDASVSGDHVSEILDAKRSLFPF